MNKKRIFSIIIVFSLLISLISCTETSARAKARLNLKTKTIYTGKSFTIKMRNTNKKVKWKISNKKIKITKKTRNTAKIKGMKTGVSYVKAILNKKTYKCKVLIKTKKKVNTTVKSTFTSKKITYNLHDTGEGVVAIVQNFNSSAASIDAKLVYYDDFGNMIDTKSDYNYCLESNRECVLFFLAPYDSNFDDVPYSRYELVLNSSKSSYSKYAAKNIQIVDSNFGADNVTAQIYNGSNLNLDSIHVSIVFYDSSGRAIGHDYTFAECEAPESTDYITFDFPYDRNYDTIYPSSYKIYIDYAYKYW